MRIEEKEKEKSGNCLKWLTLSTDEGSYRAHIAVMEHMDEVIIYVASLGSSEVQTIKISKEVK